MRERMEKRMEVLDKNIIKVGIEISRLEKIKFMNMGAYSELETMLKTEEPDKPVNTNAPIEPVDKTEKSDTPVQPVPVSEKEKVNEILAKKSKEEKPIEAEYEKDIVNSTNIENGTDNS